MKKIKLNGIDEEIIYEKLSNGLEVYLYNKEGITSVLIGASKPEQILDNIGMIKNTSFTPEHSSDRRHAGCSW